MEDFGKCVTMRCICRLTQSFANSEGRKLIQAHGLESDLLENKPDNPSCG